MGAGPRENVGPHAVQKRVPQGVRPRGESAQNGAHGVLHVLACRLRRLDVHVHAAVLTGRATVQQGLERKQDGGLARLAGRMQHEVPLVPHESQNLGEIHPFERRDAVVVLGDDWTFGVESAHGSKYGTQVFEWRRRPGFGLIGARGPLSDRSRLGGQRRKIRLPHRIGKDLYTLDYWKHQIDRVREVFLAILSNVFLHLAAPAEQATPREVLASAQQLRGASATR